MELTARSCTPCRGGIPPLGRDAAEKLLAEVPGWTLAGDAAHIERTLKFPDFAAALAFVNRVGELAETEGHHPDLNFGWGYCRVLWQTHKIGGLHENDFIMAAKVNGLAP